MPVFILFFGVVFALLSALKLKNRVLGAVQRINKTKEEKDVEKKEEESKKDNRNSKDVKEKINIAKDQTLIISILTGERAILNEYDAIKKKEDRNKLLRFNQPANQNDDLESKGSKN